MVLAHPLGCCQPCNGWFEVDLVCGVVDIRYDHPPATGVIQSGMTNPYLHEDIPWTSEAREIADWIVAQGLRGSNELELLDGFCERLNRCGAALIRAQIARHTLHPIFGAYASQWRAGKGVSQESFARGSDLNENWKRSPFAHMIENHLPEYRMALEQTNEPLPFPILDELRGDGATEYVAFILPWGKADGFETEEGYASSWATNVPGGFSDEHMDLLRKLIGPFGLAIKTAGMLKMGGSLVETYLGRDAGWRVLHGEIQRGSMEVIDAVLWNCDIRGFTAAADWMPWNELITMLNDYLECIARPVEDGGGQILKFMGDGFIATFDLCDLDEAKVCRAAIDGVKNVQSALADLNASRASTGQPVFEVDIALHQGELMYGNIGSRDRLDFTVVGPAVTEVSRMEALCSELGVPVLVSRKLYDLAESSGMQAGLKSMGLHELRGVREPQELFTLEVGK